MATWSLFQHSFNGLVCRFRVVRGIGWYVVRGRVVPEDPLDLLGAVVGNHFSPALQDQPVAKAALRHDDMVLRVPPDRDDVLVLDSRMRVADHQQERALLRLASIGTQIHGGALHLAFCQRLIQRPFQRSVLLPAAVLDERRQFVVLQVLEAGPAEHGVVGRREVDVVVDVGNVVLGGEQRVVDGLVGAGQRVEGADLPVVEGLLRRMPAALVNVQRQDADHCNGGQREHQRLVLRARGSHLLNRGRSHRYFFISVALSHSTASRESSFPWNFRPSSRLRAQIPHQPAFGSPMMTWPMASARMLSVEKASCGAVALPSGSKRCASICGSWFRYSISISACGTGLPLESTTARNTPPTQLA